MELKITLKPNEGILTVDELIDITDKACESHRTTWHDSIAGSGYESLVISIYEAVNREASKKILRLIKESNNENNKEDTTRK